MSRKTQLQNTTETSRSLLIAAGGLAVLFSVPVIWILSVLNHAHSDAVERSFVNLQHQLAQVESDKQEIVWLYDTSGTDELLAIFSGNSKVHRLFLEMTDVSDAGFKHVSQMPELHGLKVSGGRPGMTDGGLAAVANSATIVELELINTRVTDDGLASLRGFQALRSLVLCYNAVNKPPISDAAFGNLEKVDNLQRLRIGGPWMSTGAVNDLRSSLPNCDVAVLSQYDSGESRTREKL